MSPVLDVPGLAAYLGVSVRTVRQQMAARAWPCTRVGRQIRFTEAHVAQILADREQPAATAPRVVVDIRASRRRTA